MDPPAAKEVFVMKATALWNLTLWNGTIWHGLRGQFWSHGQQLFNDLTYLPVDHRMVFPPSGSNSTQQLDTVTSCGANYTHWDFRLLLMRNLIEEAGKSKDPALPVWLEDQVQPQQMLCDSRAAITSTGQRNHPPNSVVVCVHFAAGERAESISATDLTWAYVWYLVSCNITPVYF